MNNGTSHDQQQVGLAHLARPHESAAHFTRGGGPPAPGHDASLASRTSRIKAEQCRLLQWAEENGKLGSRRRLPPEFTHGGEHTVFYQKRTQRYIKATLPDRQRGYGIAFGNHDRGATPSEYLDRLDLQNLIFHDDIRLERVIAHHGRPIIVTSQPAIRALTEKI